MIFRKKIFSLKQIAIFVSFIIVLLILWNTYIFFQKFKLEERAKMEILAAALEELNSNTDLDASVALPLKILENSHNIPSILLDENNTIISFENLNKIKVKDPKYLADQLAKMKQENEPIEVSYKGENKQFIYYRNSDLLNKLTYYPLALILILFLFLSVIYLLFNSSKIAETNKLWTGMAKETAHQIGTPLSSLLGWIAILKMEKANEDYVYEIEKDVHRLNTIAERFSKIGSVPELKKQNIVTVTKTAYAYLESRSSKQIRFHFSSSHNEILIKINKELFGWVIENVIKNGIDAMKGKGNLSLSINDTPKNVKLIISDTGKGIQKALFKQIFNPGFTTKKRGWGLGLSLSKRIIKDYHNGKIFVQKSEIDKGTSIEILLQKIS